MAKSAEAPTEGHAITLPGRASANILCTSVLLVMGQVCFPQGTIVSSANLPSSSEDSSLVVTLEEQVSGIFPVSRTIVGNIILIVFYGLLLAFGAKLISDGAELLLEVTNPVVIGGLVLPVLGAVPDSAIILVSGLGADAQRQLVW